MKNRNLLSIKKLAVLGICVSFVAGGCGKMTESSIPKLEEPVALNEAYRPVEYGTIGSLQVLMATAVPRDYCNYYSFALTLGQILAKERAVLYLNMEEYSGFEELMGKGFMFSR